jgi:1-acyl-sn-glycerol-3-phosphate acyltransferase
MQKFDAIRPYYDDEVNPALIRLSNHPMMKALMNFTFPDAQEAEWKEHLKKLHSVQDFQGQIIFESVKQVIKRTSDGLTTSGFEKLDKNTSYMFISNHRDIILDTSFLNLTLFENNLLLTASAIGDNLVKKLFLDILAKLNRNFLVQRGLTPREMLQSSKLMSEYICKCLLEDTRSVWIAQREGRTKDGNDSTHPGVLKMLSMGSNKATITEYFKAIKIVPVTISYEYDPTDALKMPQLMAEANNEIYIKEKNEDFMTLLSGIMGQKKHVHIHAGDILDTEIDAIAAEIDNPNKQIHALAQAIDHAILKNYKLWPTNYIALDLLNKNDHNAEHYSEYEKSLFKRRLGMKINGENAFEFESFLNMYANPVINKRKNM